MQRQTAFLFGIHMHQPVDNFSEVIDRAVTECYAPFFEIAERYEAFRFSVHCSGWLLEQIRDRFPELFKTMVKMAKRGSIELFGAGFYEPILSTIPSADRRTQIDRLSEMTETHFGSRPRGLWLTERVWESSLIPDVASQGIRYTVMDDYHFQCTGFDAAKLDGYYLTEEGGIPLGLFPISKKLRYAIPFLPVDEAIAAIKSYSRETDSAAILFDDAEKFGMWPNTYEWVYTEGWLERFIEAVLDDDAIAPMCFGEYFDAASSRGVAYLPNVSYYEMGEWSLGADDALEMERLIEGMGQQRFETEGVKFIKGGIWKNFLVKYVESNRIHKRMLELSALSDTINDPEFSENLYRLQTNDVLWHGVFGGLYLPNLRDNAFRYLIGCERVRHAGKDVITAHNPEMDAHPKALIATRDLVLRFDAQHGGQLTEFDCKASRFNWQNSLTRRRESYHAKILAASESPKEETGQEGIDTIHTMDHRVDEAVRSAMVYDWYLKHSFIDHISDASFTLERFKKCRFKEYGDFANQPFEMTVADDAVTFERRGGVYLPERRDAVLKKRFVPEAEGFGFEIGLTLKRDGLFYYALELNLHFAKPEDVTINGSKAHEGVQEQVDSLRIVDPYTRRAITLEADERFKLLYAPLQTVSQSEQGYDLTTQAISFALLFPFEGALKFRGSIKVHDV